MLRRTASGISPRTTTSDTAKRPPGLSTRNASWSTRRLSAERLITQFEMITSTEASGGGMFSISPFRNSTFVTPALRWFSRANPSISSVMSRPYAFPVAPTRCADSSTSIPPPDPKSSTISPSCSSARAVGLPQPSDASTAPSGSVAVSAASYRFELTGSHPQLTVPLQLPRAPPATRSAACPYFCFTVCLISSPPMCSPLLINKSCWVGQKKFLGTAGPRAAAGVLPRLHVGRELGNLGERVAAQRLVHPSPLPPIGYESRVLERLQMEGQP